MLEVIGAIGAVVSIVAFVWFLWDKRRRVGKVLGQLDSSCVEVIKTRKKIEADALVIPPTVMAPFSPPPDGPGRYGPLSNPEARRVFAKLHELGIIEPVSFDVNQAVLAYRWTRFGDRVAAKLGA